MVPSSSKFCPHRAAHKRILRFNLHISNLGILTLGWSQARCYVGMASFSKFDLGWLTKGMLRWNGAFLLLI